MNTANSDTITEYFRVTSVSYYTKNYAIFSGVPLKNNSYKINSGKYIVTITTKAVGLPVEPAIGQHWEVTGVRTIQDIESNGYKMQQHGYAEPHKVVCSLPQDGEALIKFIGQEKDFRGIGNSKARAIWGLLGKNFHATLKHDTPESRQLLRSVLSDDSVDALYAGYEKYKNLAAANWMSEHNIPSEVQHRLLKYHNEKSIEAIKGNPYLLIGFGLKFVKVDEIAIEKFNIELNNPNRLAASVEAAIRKEIEKGHTFTTQHNIKPTVRKLLDCADLTTQAFQVGYQKEQFILNSETGYYHPTAQLFMEKVVAKRLLSLAQQSNLYNDASESAFCAAKADLPYPLLKKQEMAVMTSLDNAVSCITGGAGTGKTTVLRTVLQAYSKIGFVIHAVALSGRASMRLHESIGFKTMTIAALLKLEPIEPSADQPDHLLVIDESSMIDLPTMYRIVTHIHPSVRIIMTGDPDQLPPIGCGKVLADVVASGAIANTMLDIVKRQEGSSGIPEYSKLVNAGIVPTEISTGAITFHETAKNDIAKTCTELFQADPKRSRILGATKVMVAEINKLTQNATNPDGQRLEFDMYGDRHHMDLRLDDAILFTQNNYDKGIQNGSLGTLAEINFTTDSYGVVELDTGDRIEITKAVLECMQLGYCITLHKAQGSQFPRIIIALQKGNIVDRAWLYTAITRAEHEIHIVGSLSDFVTITAEISNANRRNSYLVELLKNPTPVA